MSSPLHEYEASKWRLSGDGSSENVSASGTKNSEIRKYKKSVYFVVKTIRPRDVP